MHDSKQMSLPPLDGKAVLTLETALSSSPTKTILLEINDVMYQVSREGRWFKFSLLTKKRTPKRSTMFANLTELYNQVIHGHCWRITECYAL